MASAFLKDLYLYFEHPENHTIRLRLYNNDFTQSFRVIVEGRAPMVN